MPVRVYLVNKFAALLTPAVHNCVHYRYVDFYIDPVQSSQHLVPLSLMIFFNIILWLVPMTILHSVITVIG